MPRRVGLPGLPWSLESRLRNFGTPKLVLYRFASECFHCKGKHAEREASERPREASSGFETKEMGLGEASGRPRNASTVRGNTQKEGLGAASRGLETKEMGLEKASGRSRSGLARP